MTLPASLDYSTDGTKKHASDSSMDLQTTQRLEEVDFGRGLAVFLMMLVHTLWMYADIPTQSETWLGAVIHFMGKGTAAFLLLMGLSFILTKNQSLKSAVMKGLLIIGFAYFMNTLKFIVPLEVFGTMPESFVNAYGWNSPLTMGQLTYIVLTGDILQMAGISFILVGLLRYFVKSKYAYLALACLVAVVSKLVSGYQPGIDGLNYVARLFFSDHYQVYFPVFPWMSFILFGMFFGRLIEEQPNAYMKSMFRFGLLSLLVGGGLMFLDFEYHFGNFFHLGPGGVFYLLGITLILLRVVFVITCSGRLNTVTRFFKYLSARVTSIYIIQWTLICWGMGIFGFQQHGVIGVLLLMPLVVFTTLATQFMKDRLFQVIKNQSPTSKVMGNQTVAENKA